MKKILIYLISLFSLLPFTAYAATLETLQVTSLTDAPTVSSTVLENGKSYLIEVQGTYTYSSGDRIADAEFAFSPDDNQFFEELQGVVDQQFNLDLMVNGQPVDWLGSTDGATFYTHTFSPDHKYRLSVVGQGEPISFAIHDSSYDWNQGSLTVSISNMAPTDKKSCKKDGWKTFSSPTFASQGECINFVQKSN